MKATWGKLQRFFAALPLSLFSYTCTETNLTPVNVHWENQIEQCMRLETIGGAYVSDLWGARHFVVAAKVESPGSMTSCCGPTRAVDYEVKAEHRVEGRFAQYVFMGTKDARWGADQTLSFVLPDPWTEPEQETLYTVQVTCGPHD